MVQLSCRSYALREEVVCCFPCTIVDINYRHKLSTLFDFVSVTTSLSGFTGYLRRIKIKATIPTTAATAVAGNTQESPEEDGLVLTFPECSTSSLT